MQNKDYQKNSLLRCPFCGGKAELNERYRKGTANRKMYWISCRKCGISQPHHNLAGYRRISGAITAWNRRKPIEDIIEQLSARADAANDNIDFEDTIEGKNYYDGKEDGLREAIEVVKGKSNG